MIANFDDFNRLKQPSLILTNPEEIPISYIDEAYIKNFIFKPKFNDISEITFDIYEHSLNSEIFESYRKLIQRMRITVEGYGSWIISEVSEKKSNIGEANYKSVTLKSTEYEIQNIQIPYIDGTYKLYDIAEYGKSLLGTVLSKIPKWSIEHVDLSISSLYRTFEVPDTNVLSFLLNDVQEAYGCLFIFDCARRKISVYDRDTYVRYSGILLTNDELIDSMEITRSDENLITVLSVFGDDDLGINAVNPLGTSSIYNFSQVKRWMTPELLAKINAWEKEVSDAEEIVKNKNIELSKLNAELTSIETQVSSQEQTVKGLKAERDAIVSKNNQSELGSINSQISAAEVQLSSYKTNQTNKQAQIVQKQNELSTIQTKLSPANYFGNLYYNFLSYVYENEYTNDNIAVTDSMTYEEEINMKQVLYDTAKDVLLQKVNIPNEYSVDTKGFVFNKKFINHTHVLEVGNLIGVETEGSNDGKIEYFPVLEFEVNYEDRSMKIVFGNKFNSARAQDLFADLMHDISSTGKILDYIAAKKANTSEISDMRKFIISTLDLSKNAILSADGQTVEITDSGYHGRRLLPDGSLDKEEVAIINNTIAFTRDNWNTCSLALGKLTLPNGNNVYGIIAEALIGTLIMGERLYISNSQNTFTIDEDGLTITNGTNTFTVNPNDDKLLRLFKEDKDIFYVDKNGLLHLSGDGAGLDISSNNAITGINQSLEVMDGKFESSISDLNGKTSKMSQTLDKVSTELTNTYTDWNISGYKTQYSRDVNYKGYGEPDSTKYPFGINSGKSYLDTNNGKIYYCNGSSWMFVYQCSKQDVTQESLFLQELNKISMSITNAYNDAVSASNDYTQTSLTIATDNITSQITASHDDAINNAKTYTDSTFSIANDSISSKISSVCTSWDVSGYWHDINYKGYGVPTEDKYPISECRGKTYLDVNNGYVYYCCNDDGSYEHWFHDNDYICPRSTLTQESQIKQTVDIITSSMSNSCQDWDITKYTHDVNYKGYGAPTEDRYPINQYRGKTYLDIETGHIYYCCNDDGSYEHWFDDYRCPRSTIIYESQIKQTANSISQKVDANGVISAINLTKGNATIDASKINLNGVVTANNRFKINLDGSMETTDGRFSGTIEGSHIKSGYIDGTNMFFSLKTVDPSHPKADGQGGIVCDTDKTDWTSLDIFGIDELVLSTSRSVNNGGTVSVDRVFNAKRGITLSSETLEADNFGWLDWYSTNEFIGSIFANDESLVIQSRSGKNLSLNSITDGSGNINYYGNLVQNSSVRYKHNIENITEDYANKILKLNPVEYDYIGSNRHSLGLIAEDVIDTIPQLVVLNAEGQPDAVSYIELIPLIIKQLQILNDKIKEK